MVRTDCRWVANFLIGLGEMHKNRSDSKKAIKNVQFKKP
jgi:hypothetical protein